MTCANKDVDMSRILPEVKQFIDNKLEKAYPSGQPARWSATETSISYWSSSFATSNCFNDLEPEADLPAKGFFCDTNAGKIAVFSTMWPVLPVRTRVRMLQTYLNSTDGDIQKFIVGGSMAQEVVGAENVASRMNPPMHFYVNGTLSLFMSSDTYFGLCDVETDGPHSVLAELHGSAEKLATTTNELEECLAQPQDRSATTTIEPEEPLPHPGEPCGILERASGARPADYCLSL